MQGLNQQVEDLVGIEHIQEEEGIDAHSSGRDD
jgi:hypothetical protein